MPVERVWGSKISMDMGVMGRVLRVNLSKGTIKTETPGAGFYRKYIGGRAAALHYLLSELPAGVDPLSPDNVLVFFTAPPVGTQSIGFSRFTCASKSPLTGAYGEGEAGGYWAPELKKAGWDGIVVEGKSDSPCYLLIHDSKVEIEDAKGVWGLKTKEAQERIREENRDKRLRVLQIGPAGENLVRFACIVNELRHFVGRTGLGAVMGSKNLKAIAVRGTGKVQVADPEKLKSLNRWFLDNYRKNPDVAGLSKYGTAQYINSQNQTCQLPTRNFRTGFFEDAERLSGEAIKDEIFAYDYGCYVCPIKCKKAVKTEDADPEYGGPEYEGLGALGSLCCVGDVKAVAKANEVCNSTGMDVISAGVTVAFAMECFEAGLLDKEDTGGLDLRFGNGKALVRALEMTAKVEGIGRLLSKGAAVAAEELGGRAKGLAMHVKGLEIPLHEPRRKGSLALAYSLSPTGADHLQGEHDFPFSKKGFYLERLAPLGIHMPLVPESLGHEKVRFFVLTQKWNSAGNSVGICNFARGPIRVLDFDRVVSYMNAVTGWDFTLEKLLEVGERGVTMARLFNVREGFKAEDDALPERFFTDYHACGKEFKGLNRDGFSKALKDYYRLMGWDELGIPTKDKLKELDVG